MRTSRCQGQECMAELLKEKEARIPKVGGTLDRTTHASTERSEDGSTEQDATIDPPTGPVVEGSRAATSGTVTPLTEDVLGSAAMVETMTTFLQHRQKLWLLMLIPLLCGNFLPYHLTLEKGNRLQMTALNDGLRDLGRELRLLAGRQSINCTN